ncbi:hypothetical protein RFI_11327 [Reticulomyxa filosa]|uniref:Uncharacterized protein n=1 Tax=Reticulomyxa filosa TaxID=46433 RepID=X6NHK9_RETFI|nr:hypothetical protein RFI_11327 [Reticulomyxa filosa]|eukprot:ETO25810.1 hypothetical protein RFI_11327 [Reticulomyxa filosa]
MEKKKKRSRDENLYSPEVEVNLSDDDKDKPIQKTKKNDTQITEGLMRKENSDIWSALSLLTTAMQNESPLPSVQPQNQPYQATSHLHNSNPLPNTFQSNAYPSPVYPQSINNQTYLPLDPRVTKRNRIERKRAEGLIKGHGEEIIAFFFSEISFLFVYLMGVLVFRLCLYNYESFQIFPSNISIFFQILKMKKKFLNILSCWQHLA